MQFFIYLKLLLAFASFFFAGYIPVYFLLIKKKAILHFPGIVESKLNDAIASGRPGTGFSGSLSGKFFIFFLSFYAGIFLISNYLIILSLAKIKYSLCAAAIFAAVCFAAFAAIVILNKIRGKKNGHTYSAEQCFLKNPKTEKILFAIICFFIFLSFCAVIFFTLLFPVRFWDAISCWSLKGRAFFTDGSILPFFNWHSYGFAHLSYPLYVPLAQTWIYIWLGYADEVLVKIIFPVFYLSLIFILYYCFRKKFARVLSSIFVFILSGLPVIMDHGYLEYTNLVFAVCLFIAVYCFYLSILEDKNISEDKLRLVLISALFFTILVQIRSEGVLFLAIFLIANLAKRLALLFKERKYKNIKINGAVKNSMENNTGPKTYVLQIIAPIIFSMLLMLPWQFLKRALNIPFASTEWSRLFELYREALHAGSFPPGGPFAGLISGPGIIFDYKGAFTAMASQLLYSAYDSARAFFGSSYGIIWVVLILLFAINIKKMLSGSNWVYPLFIIPGSIALFISMALIPEFAWSTDRYVLHLFPLTYFWILYNLPLSKRGGNKL